MFGAFQAREQARRDPVPRRVRIALGVRVHSIIRGDEASVRPIRRFLHRAPLRCRQTVHFSKCYAQIACLVDVD